MNNQGGMGVTTMRIKQNVDKVQIKEQRSFVNWANWILNDENLRIKNLTRDLSDGIVLVKIAERLVGESLKFIANPKTSMHKYENINVATNALKDKMKNLIIPNASVFENEQLPPILGFFYQLIIRFTYGWSEKDERASKEKSSFKAAFEWAEKIAKKYDNCKDFKPSVYEVADFKNGDLIKSIVHYVAKGTEEEFEMEDIEDLPPNEQADYIMKKADALGIPRFFGLEDIVDGKVPTEKQLVPWLLCLKARKYEDKHNPENKHSLFHRKTTFVETQPENESNENIVVDLEEEERERNNKKVLIEHDHHGDQHHDHDDHHNHEHHHGDHHNHHNDHHNHEHHHDHHDDEKYPQKEFTTRSLNESSLETKLRCTTCVKFLGGKIIIADGFLYHEACFVCSKCSSPINSPFYTHDNKPYCSVEHLPKDDQHTNNYEQENPREHHLEERKHTEQHHEPQQQKPSQNKKILEEDKGQTITTKVLSEEEKNIKCDKCEKAITSEVATALGKRYHPQCFVCTKCSCSFDKVFYPYKEKPYCHQHYLEAAGIICKRCKEVIGESVFTYVSDSKYHTKCFNCVHCTEPLTNKYYLFDDKTYCIPHYHLISGTICYFCEKIIDTTISEALGKKFHEKCFTCFTCQGNIQDSFVPKNGLPFCNKCYNYHRQKEDFPHAPNDETCGFCNQLIFGNITSGCGKEWHEECFRCANLDCRKLIKSKFMNLNGFPYCDVCAEKMDV